VCPERGFSDVSGAGLEAGQGPGDAVDDVWGQAAANDLVLAAVPPGSSLACRRRLSTGAIDKASVLLAVLEAIIVAMEREEARRT
jgi:hypothetical protein